MRLSNGWTILLLAPGFAGFGLGVYNLCAVIRGTGVEMLGLSVQIAALSVIVVTGVFFLTALVLTRMDSIRRETLLAVDGGKTARDKRLKERARNLAERARSLEVELGGNE